MRYLIFFKKNENGFFFCFDKKNGGLKKNLGFAFNFSLSLGEHINNIIVVAVVVLAYNECNKGTGTTSPVKSSNYKKRRLKTRLIQMALIT